MVLSGYCSVLKKEVTINAEVINATAKEDGIPKFILGRLNCPYSSANDCMANPCSVKEKYMN